MKVLKIILIVVTVIAALFLLVAAFLPAEYRVERSAVIGKPVEEVYSYTVDFTYRAAWDPWFQMEPTAGSEIHIAEGFLGSSWTWEGEKLGSGTLTIRELVENESIVSSLEFRTPRPASSTVRWAFQTVEEGTGVHWSVEGSLSYPVERFFGLMMDGMLGKDLERGLANLKSRIESAD